MKRSWRDIIEILMAIRGWDWALMRLIWNNVTGGTGIIDGLQKKGDNLNAVDQGKYVTVFAKIFDLPSSFLWILHDDDPQVAALQDLVLAYAEIHVKATRDKPLPKIPC